MVFIIPIKSSRVSKSWSLVSKLFERSIKSICNQTSDRFRVIVICQEKPEINFYHPYITYIQVDFPLPKQQLQDLALQEKVDWRGIEACSKEIDKGRKILTGLAYAEQFAPSHIMIVDADDCINKNIAKFVVENSNCNGWYLKKGYLYHEQSKFMHIKFKDFNQTCGSSTIVKYKLINLMFDHYEYKHQKVVLANGIDLKPLPFMGCIYSVGNKENFFQTIERQNKIYKKHGILLTIKNVFRYRFLTESIRNDFGFYRID